MKFIKQISYFLLLLLMISCQKEVKEVQKKPNILFIGIDDLRPELACYGFNIAVIQNLLQNINRMF